MAGPLDVDDLAALQQTGDLLVLLLQGVVCVGLEDQRRRGDLWKEVAHGRPARRADEGGIRMMASFGGCPELAFGPSPFRRILHAALDERFFAGVVAGDDARAAAFRSGLAGRRRRGRPDERGVLEDHRPRHVGIFRGKVGDRCAAHRVPHQNRLVQLQLFDETREILDLNVGRIRRRRWIGQAVATRVEHDDVEVVLKLFRQIGPAQSIIRRAVREYQHRLVPSGAPVVDADSVCQNVTVRPSGRRWWTRGER